MRASLRSLPYFGLIALLIYLPFHVFLSQWLSTITGGLGAWKLAKDVIMGGLLVVSIGLVALTTPHRQQRLFWTLTALSGLYFVLHLIVYLFNQQTQLSVALLATAYNCRLPAYFLIAYGAGVLAPKRIDHRKLIRLVLGISSLVCALGIVQYFLPPDFLTHFGYSIERGTKPFFYIDNKPELARIMSTLRDPNSLGAYLAIPITLISTLLLRGRTLRGSPILSTLLVLHGAALFLTFSRSAWLGVTMSLTVLVATTRANALKVFIRKYRFALAVGCVLAVSLVVVLRDQYVVQNIIFHSDENTQSVSDSNQRHQTYLSRGLSGIGQRPFGYGPGTAGPVSVHADRQNFFPENYYVQLGYEVGILGLALFVALQVLIYREVARRHSVLASCLLASFWGYVVMNMLLHTWSNEAVAGGWWLLAGWVLAAPPGKRSSSAA